MLPVMQVGRVRPGAPPEHDVLHPVGGALGQARPTNNIGMHGRVRGVGTRPTPDSMRSSPLGRSTSEAHAPDRRPSIRPMQARRVEKTLSVEDVITLRETPFRRGESVESSSAHFWLSLHQVPATRLSALRRITTKPCARHLLCRLRVFCVRNLICLAQRSQRTNRAWHEHRRTTFPGPSADCHRPS